MKLVIKLLKEIPQNCVFDFRLGYIINPNTNMKFEVGVLNRSFSNKNSHSDNKYIFFAFKTDLQNFYYDF